MITRNIYSINPYTSSSSSLQQQQQQQHQQQQLRHQQQHNNKQQQQLHKHVYKSIGGGNNSHFFLIIPRHTSLEISFKLKSILRFKQENKCGMRQKSILETIFEFKALKFIFQQNCFHIPRKQYQACIPGLWLELEVFVNIEFHFHDYCAILLGAINEKSLQIKTVIVRQLIIFNIKYRN
ncbi:hypothetical protein DOY81_008754 [Sarcophaga bullata]|nr:hypothetical protein DOY81_008754 [Sarcophaga bullata]